MVVYSEGVGVDNISSNRFNRWKGLELFEVSYVGMVVCLFGRIEQYRR
jgi:hypothetical protein